MSYKRLRFPHPGPADGISSAEAPLPAGHTDLGWDFGTAGGNPAASTLAVAVAALVEADTEGRTPVGRLVPGIEWLEGSPAVERVRD